MRTGLITCLLFASSFAFADGAKLMESKGCVSCHGKDGNGAVAADGKIDPQYPKLAGQYASYLAYALKGYRSGERVNAIMAGFAKELSDQDIAEISKYLSSQPGKLHDLHGVD
jgi:cytochrome c553